MIDIGAGNANLSCLISLVFDVPVICVEMDSPRDELRAEYWLPPHMKEKAMVTRVESLIQEYSLPDCYQRVLVLGKHLCGPGTDAGIEFVRKHLDRMIGCVFATCCCCKIVGGPGAGRDGANLFADLYFGESNVKCVPCNVDDENAAEAAAAAATTAEQEAARANGEAIDRKEMARAKDRARLMAAKEQARQNGKQLCRRFLRYGCCDDGEGCRFYHCMSAPPDAEMEGGEEFDGDDLFRRYRFPTTTTNAAAEQQQQGESSSTAAADEPIDGAFLRRVLPAVARATSWRNAVFNNQHTHTNAYSELLEEAEFFESWIQGFRRRRLHELFGNEHEVLYCADDVHSQQNRCLLSGRYLDSSGGGDEYASFFKRLEDQYLKHEACLPLDLRVRGLVSAKFGYDGTELQWDPATAVS